MFEYMVLGDIYKCFNIFRVIYMALRSDVEMF